MDSGSTVDRLLDDFKNFVKERVSPMDIVRERVASIVAVLQHPQVALYPLGVRIAFLKFKSFSNAEIEAALEQFSEVEYLRYLEAVQNGEPVESLSLAQVHSASSTAQTAGAVDAAEANDTPGSDHALLWRVGAMVYAFKGDGSYFPVPFVGIDAARTEDVLMIRHQLPDGAYGPVQYLTAGFKGVVPDEFAPYELVQIGMTVIAEFPEAYRNHFKEAVIIGKSATCNADGSYTVDIEWVHTSERRYQLEHRCIRLLEHPKKMQAYLQQAATERRRNQSSGQQYNSTTSFLMHPAERPMSKLLQSITVDGADAPEYIKNFVKFPHLDRGVQPRTLRTGAQFVAQYGQYFYDEGIKTFPLLPPSQVDGSMNAFEFQLQHLERHPLDHRFYVRNPTVDLADECYRRDAMFVDPDFPPSLYSITGSATEIPKGVVWRRCSEIFSKPRLFTVGSKALDIVPGRYTPSWFVGVMHALQGVAEIEELISPGEDGWAFGVYAVKLFLDGQWVFSVVDDFIPCDEDTGAPLSAVSSSSGEIYCTILEKVLAKTIGCYAALRYSPLSVPAKAWEDLSSNTLEYIDHALLVQKDDVCENFCAVVNSGANTKVLARVKGDDGRYEDIGFHKQDYWVVDAVAQYLPPNRRVPLYFFHVCRPTHVGKPVPYAESHKEKFFQQFPPHAVDHFPTRGLRDDGLHYWISSSDYFTIFERSVLLWFYNNTQRVVVPATFRGHDNAAPKMFGISRWFANPQIYLSFVQPTDVIIEVKLLDRRLPSRLPLDTRLSAVLQAHLVRGLPVEQPLTQETDYFASSQAVDLRDDQEARNHPSAVIRATLPGGNFVLVPSLAEHCTEDLLVKVFSVSAFYGKVLN